MTLPATKMSICFWYYSRYFIISCNIDVKLKPYKYTNVISFQSNYISLLNYQMFLATFLIPIFHNLIKNNFNTVITNLTFHLLIFWWLSITIYARIICSAVFSFLYIPHTSYKRVLIIFVHFILFSSLSVAMITHVLIICVLLYKIYRNTCILGLVKVQYLVTRPGNWRITFIHLIMLIFIWNWQLNYTPSFRKITR